ncbi:cell adhesion molecule Dscam1-like [Brevipalpus obovatus]|uniref:cell adhesion molecule Dscam1-like n=1 Tax=Brevipalpus obovatus TaxID=246614 RepID=UPI003D9F4B35
MYPSLVSLSLLSVITSIDGQRRAPTFVQEPDNRIVFTNNTGYKIACSASGNPKPSVSWYHKSGHQVIDIAGIRHVSADGSLVFPAFRADDWRLNVHSTSYYCLAANPLASILSRDVSVRAVVAQHYTATVADELVFSGNTAVLRCNIPAHVREVVEVVSWTENNLKIVPKPFFDPSDRYTMFPTGELHISKVDHKDGTKEYRCQTRFKLSSTTTLDSGPGRLMIQDPFVPKSPSIISGHHIVSMAEGELAFLPCASQGHPPPAHFWLKLEDYPKFPVRWEPINRYPRFLQTSDGSLAIGKLRLQDAGKYRCHVNNSEGSEVLETQLITTVPLSVDTHPDTLLGDIGKPVKFNCTQRGNPPGKFEWFHNGVRLSSNSRVHLSNNGATLFLDKVGRDDRGAYQCMVSNGYSSAQKASFLRLIDDPPTFLHTFEGITMEKGGPLSLSCVATGTPLPQVTWTLDGYPVPDNSRFRTGDYVTKDNRLVSYVNITLVMAEDGGQYECTASNILATARHSRRINVYGPPFIRPMKNGTAIASDILILNCPVGGYPIESIHWEREGKSLPYNHRQQVRPNGTLIVTDVQRNTDQGLYTCVASGRNGQKASGSLYVSVLVKPFIQPFTFGKDLHSGQRHNALCSVVEGDSPIEIRWLKDGVPIETILNRSHPLRIEMIQVGDFSSHLTFASLGPEHSGNYTCNASNVAGSAQHSARMMVNVAPVWQIEPQDIQAVKDRIALVDCQAGGFPLPRIHWSKAEGYLQEPPENFRPISSSPHVRVFENGSLVIHNVQKSDMGFYLCQATNNISPGLSKMIKLSVHVAAHMEHRFTVHTVRKGEEARVSCKVIGDKPINISWYKEKIPFNSPDDQRYHLTQENMPEGITSIISIENVRRGDSALYKCSAGNSYGKDETNIQLLLHEPPEPPQNLNIVSKNSRSVTANWSVSFSGNSPILRYIIEYKLEKDKWNSRKVINLTTTDASNSYELNNLNPMTTYHLRVFAENLIGRSEASQAISFTTSEEAPGGPPLHIKAKATSSKSIQVTWKPPAKELTYGPIKGYHIGYKPKDNPGNNGFTYKIVDASDGHQPSEECHIKGLNKATKYLIVVQAFNNKGSSPASEEIVIQTAEKDPPTEQILKIVSKTSYSINLTWSSIQEKLFDGELSDDIQGYTIYHRKLNTDQWDSMSLPSDRKSFEYKGLQCGTAYQFYIQAQNEIGASDPSHIVTARLDGSAPVPPNKESLLALNSTTAVIHLDAWHDGGCRMERMEIMFKQTRKREWTSLPFVYTSSKEDRDIIIPDLQPMTPYELKITAKNEADTTQAVYSFQTHPRTIDKNSFPIGGELSSPSLASQNAPYFDINLVLSTSLAVGVTLIAFSLVFCLLFLRKRQTNLVLYDNGSIYESNKRPPCTESLHLTQMDSGSMKKISCDGNSGLDSGYFPSPYAMTKIEDDKRDMSCIMADGGGRLHTSPLKQRHQADVEPLYATVKRTPRPPRSDVHVYHFPTNQSLSSTEGGLNGFQSEALYGQSISKGQICQSTTSCGTLTQPKDEVSHGSGDPIYSSLSANTQPIVIYSQRLYRSNLTGEVLT